jgi:hypothetical protein
MSNLTEKSTQQLAEAIAQQVFEYISEDGRYLDGLMNTIEPAIVSVIGQVTPELVGELSVTIMDMICIPSDPDVYQDDLWKTRYERLYRYVKHTYAESYIDGAEYGILVPEDLYGY